MPYCHRLYNKLFYVRPLPTVEAINLTTQKVDWTFQTDGSVKNGATYTKADSSPNYDAAFDDEFYDDMSACTGCPA